MIIIERSPAGRRPHPRTGTKLRRLVLTSIAPLIIMTAATASSPRAAADDEGELHRACQTVSDTMPAPTPSGVGPAHASPRSPFTRGAMYVPPYAAATRAAEDAAAAGRDQTASRLTKITQQPRAIWLTDPRAGATATTARVRTIVAAAYARQQVPTLVVYGIPLRDCGQWSAGGATSGRAHQEWVRAIATGIRAAGPGPGTAVIMEPDALGLLDWLPTDRQAERLDLLRAATTWLTRVPDVAVYLDAGHSAWIDPAQMVQRLSAAGVAMARGFSLDVSNTQTTEEQVRYGLQLSPSLGWKRFVVDTSRNGHGPPTAGEWCNPTGRALGAAPTAGPGLVDAYLWVKPPGESDGACRPGAPSAGTFWPEYADDLAQNAGW